MATSAFPSLTPIAAFPADAWFEVETVAALDVGGLRTGIMVTAAAALAGMAFGRLFSRLVDKPTAFYPVWFYFGVEILAAALLAIAA